MRLALPIVGALLMLAACQGDEVDRIPKLEKFYFPTGIAHARGTGADSLGTLYVASSDFDKRYDFGAVTAVDLDALDWASASGANRVITDLKLSESQRVLTAPFAGLLAKYQPENPGPARLLIPTRSEEDRLYAIDADGTALSCQDAGNTIEVDGTSIMDCTAAGHSLTRPGFDSKSETDAAGFASGKPRAPAPFAAAVRQDDGTVFVTHLVPSDSPRDSFERPESYVVTGNAQEPEAIGASADDFVTIGVQPSSGVAVGRRYAYVTGRSAERPFPPDIPPALRLVERGPDGAPRRLEVNLESDFRSLSARGITLFPQGPGAVETRAFMLVRSPDALLVLSIEEAQSDFPRVSILRSILLPASPTAIELIPRAADRGALLAITCTGADSLALYDDETGQLASVISNVGRQPFDVAVDERPSATMGEPSGARLYVSNFEDGTVGVVEIPNVNRPYNASLIATLGESQVCLTEPDSTACAGVTQ